MIELIFYMILSYLSYLSRPSSAFPRRSQRILHSRLFWTSRLHCLPAAATIPSSHLFGGRPNGRFISLGYHSSNRCVHLSSFKRRTCPAHLIFLFLYSATISMNWLLLLISSFVILSRSDIFSTLLSIARSVTRNPSSCALVRFQVSHPYNIAGNTVLLKSWALSFAGRFWRRTSFMLLKEHHPALFLLESSSAN